MNHRGFDQLHNTAGAILVIASMLLMFVLIVGIAIIFQRGIERERRERERLRRGS